MEVRSVVTRVLNRLGCLTYFRLSKRDSKGRSFEAGETPKRSESIFFSSFPVDVKFNCQHGARNFPLHFFCQEGYLKKLGGIISLALDRPQSPGQTDLEMTQRRA